MLDFKNTTNGFNFIFEKEFSAGEEQIVKMPPVSPNKRGINDIGWQTDGKITIYGTLSRKPESTKLWQEIRENDDINKTVSAIKIKNEGAACTVVVRVILN